ncbi:hypothetical protein V6N13_067100 [Hibiscus sabdariffa]|uniref:TF-B3 domain-containing protein n=1 Tax=Hibiscus sabdariffa TaxID=183260 RepID=A0ABR2DU31_9ROSI
MKQECEKNKSIDNDDNGEDWSIDDEVYSAASHLVSFQYVKLDERSAAMLNKLKRKFLGGQEKHEQEEEASLIIVGGRNNIMLDGYVPPEIPPVAALAGLIAECSKPYQKPLTETDLKSGQSRFLFCKKHVGEFMLPLLKEDENVVNGIPVVVYDSEGRVYDMKFKRWGKMYVLTSSGWLTFCEQHALKKLVDIVTVWMFRHRVTEKLCFVITCRRSPPAPPVWQRQRIA